MISWVVIHLFPFSVFDMYSEGAGSGSRMVAQSADGQVAEVDHFRDWDCPAPIDLARACIRTPGYYYIAYKDSEALDYIAAHRGQDPAAREVVLVRRIWWLSEGDSPVRIEDCPIVPCRAVPR